jgi:hypothetical protein
MGFATKACINGSAIHHDAKCTSFVSQSPSRTTHWPAAIHVSSLSFRIRQDQYRSGTVQPRRPAVLNSSAGARTPFLAQPPASSSFGRANGMPIVLGKVRENLRRRSGYANRLE